MKKIVFLFLTFIALRSTGQQLNYNDFEGNKHASFGFSTGVIDSAFVNPKPNNVNSSPVCAKYIRDTATYDFMRIYPEMKLEDVSVYAFNAIQTPKIKVKMYTTAPVGTYVQLQLGSRSDDNYPSGVHSEYLAVTSVQNAWELLTFNYIQSPQGGAVAPTNVDKIVILFHPNSAARDTVYFDDLTGPRLNNWDLGIAPPASHAALRLYQNNPNPAIGNTSINFQLASPGMVSLRIFDLLGNSVSTLLNEHLKAGIYSIPVETSDIPTGIYFYELKKDGESKTMKMTVSK